MVHYSNWVIILQQKRSLVFAMPVVRLGYGVGFCRVGAAGYRAQFMVRLERKKQEGFWRLAALVIGNSFGMGEVVKALGFASFIEFCTQLGWWCGSLKWAVFE